MSCYSHLVIGTWGLKITWVCIAILFISCSIILSIKIVHFCYFQNTFPFVSTFRQTDDIRKNPSIFVDQGISHASVFSSEIEIINQLQLRIIVSFLSVLDNSSVNSTQQIELDWRNILTGTFRARCYSACMLWELVLAKARHFVQDTKQKLGGGGRRKWRSTTAWFYNCDNKS